MSALKDAHVKKISAEFKKAVGESHPGLAQNVVAELWSAFDCSTSANAELMAQFRAVCLNFRTVAPMLVDSSLTPSQLAAMEPKDMSTHKQKFQKEQIRKEELAYVRRGKTPPPPPPLKDC